jgi:hypothetical protein
MVYLELIQLAIYDVREHDDRQDVRLVGDFNRHDQLWWRQRDDKKRTVLLCRELGLERVFHGNCHIRICPRPVHSRPRARMFSPLEHGSGHRAIALVVQIDEPSLPVQERRLGTRHKTDPSPSWKTPNGNKLAGIGATPKSYIVL